ncbi:MAG: histidine--tRNA ligase [Candidatus Saccharibacteria bacterium]
MDISAPRGTYDIMPEDSPYWQGMEAVLRRVASLYGYSEVRMPIFEHTELFERGVGDTTDIVQKEMYTFKDRGDRSLTLRPEGTASCARAFVEHKIYNQTLPAKWFYMGPMFRYDRPQAGRYRQFHQFGLEAFGSSDPTVDAEVITLMVAMVRELGLKDYDLRLNTVGCPSCRPLYRERLIQHLQPLSDRLCNDCRQRVDKNPLRVLDCKNQSCQTAIQGFPVLNEYLCERCSDHFSTVKRTLDIYNVKYTLDSQLVRGLDYYTNTAFELQLPGIGAQSAVGGGGRYDGLIKEIGGPSTPGIGFALGLERLLIALKQQAQVEEVRGTIDVFVAVLDREYEEQACVLVNELRNAGIRADKDYMGRSLKAQMKFADKTGARLVAIIGEDEVARKVYAVRDMSNQSQSEIPAGEITERIKAILT